MGTTTYEITAKLADLLASMRFLDEQIDERAAEIEAASGVLPADLAQYEQHLMFRIEKTLGEGVAKLENLALVRRDLALERDREAVNKAHMTAEADRYRARQRMVERAIDRLKGLSVSLFRATGTARHDGERIRTRVQRGAMAIEPRDPSQPPEEYVVASWEMRGPVEARLLEIVRAAEPGLMGEVATRRAFVPAMAAADAKAELAAIQLGAFGPHAEGGWEPEPGGAYELRETGVVVSFGATVIDW